MEKPYYKKDASLEYMMQCLIEEEIYEPVAMHFRNNYCRNMRNAPKEFLMCIIEETGGRELIVIWKNHLGLETHINGKGMKNIDLHITQCCVALLAVVLTRLQHGIKENLASIAYLT
jgi:hypothetical protein